MAGKDGTGGSRVSVGAFVCTHCKLDFCEGCMDVMRSIYTDERLCKCKKKEHEKLITDAISARRQSAQN